MSWVARSAAFALSLQPTRLASRNDVGDHLRTSVQLKCAPLQGRILDWNAAATPTNDSRERHAVTASWYRRCNRAGLYCGPLRQELTRTTDSWRVSCSRGLFI